MQPHRLHSYDRAGHLVLELAGEHDISTVPLIEDEIARLSDGRSRVVFDLAGVTYLDSTVLGMLLRRRERLGERMKVVLPASSPVRRIFAVTRLDDHFAVVESLGDALGENQG